MNKTCFICGIDDPMYVWSSSRDFPRHLLSKGDKVLELVLQNGVPICMKCRGKIK